MLLLMTVSAVLANTSKTQASKESVPTSAIVSIYNKTPVPPTNGVLKSYYSSGELKLEVPYTNGKKNGVERIYRKSGQLIQETPYTNDKKDGIEKWYYKSGQLMAEMPYTNGKKVNDGKRYNKSGELMETSDKNGGGGVNRKTLDNEHILNIAR